MLTLTLFCSLILILCVFVHVLHVVTCYLCHYDLSVYLYVNDLLCLFTFAMYGYMIPVWLHGLTLVACFLSCYMPCFWFYILCLFTCFVSWNMVLSGYMLTV